MVSPVFVCFWSVVSLLFRAIYDRTFIYESCFGNNHSSFFLWDFPCWMIFLNGLRNQNRVSPVVASGQVCSGMAFPPLQLYYSNSGVIAHVHTHLSQNGRKRECGNQKTIFIKKNVYFLNFFKFTICFQYQ